MVKHRSAKPVVDIRKWDELREWEGFERGDSIFVKGTFDSTWTFIHAAQSKLTGEILWVTVYGGTGGPDGNQAFRSFLPERIRELTPAEAKKKINKAAAEQRKAEKAAEKAPQLRKPRAKRG